MHDRRRALLAAALAFTRVKADAPEVRVLRTWLDCWRGVGAIAVGLARQGYDLQLTRYAEQGWRATFYTTGIAHSIIHGSAFERTPWLATQRAAWEALQQQAA